jgi:hypothetical protein
MKHMDGQWQYARYVLIYTLHANTAQRETRDTSYISGFENFAY